MLLGAISTGGHFVISANRIYMVGGLNDPEGWDHLDSEAKNVRPVSGTAEIDVNGAGISFTRLGRQ